MSLLNKDDVVFSVSVESPNDIFVQKGKRRSDDTGLTLIVTGVLWGKLQIIMIDTFVVNFSPCFLAY